MPTIDLPPDDLKAFDHLGKDPQSYKTKAIFNTRGLTVFCSPVSLYPGIPRARRLRAPHVCGLPSRRVVRPVRRHLPPRPRTRSLPRATRQHFLNLRFRRRIILVDLPIARPSAISTSRREISTQSVPHPCPGPPFSSNPSFSLRVCSELPHASPIS